MANTHRAIKTEQRGTVEYIADDLQTSDHRTFYQYGKRELWQAGSGERAQWFHKTTTSAQCECLGTFGDDHVAALRAYMAKTQFWPNAFFISDHGNAIRIEL